MPGADKPAAASVVGVDAAASEPEDPPPPEPEPELAPPVVLAVDEAAAVPVAEPLSVVAAAEL